MPINYPKFNIKDDFFNTVATNFHMPSFSEFKNFVDDGLDYFNANIRLRAMTKGLPQFIHEVFRDFVLIHIRELITENYEKLKSGKGESFNKTVYECCEKVVESLLKFRTALKKKGLDRYLDLGINIAGIAVISCLAYYCPVLAIIIPTTGIFDKFKEIISIKGLKNCLDTIKIEKDNLQNLDLISQDRKQGDGDLRLFLKNNLYNAAEKQKVIKAYINLPEEKKQIAAHLINKLNEANNIFQTKGKLNNLIEYLQKEILENNNELQPDNNDVNGLSAPKEITKIISDILQEDIVCKKIIKTANVIDEIIKALNFNNIKIEKKSELAAFKELSKELRSIASTLKDPVIATNKKLSPDFLRCIGFFNISNDIRRIAIRKRKNIDNKNESLGAKKNKVDENKNNNWVISTSSKSNSCKRTRG